MRFVRGPWVWGAIWPDGTWEVAVLTAWEALRRRDLAHGLGGPCRILLGPIPHGVSAERARAMAEERMRVLADQVLAAAGMNPGQTRRREHTE